MHRPRIGPPALALAALVAAVVAVPVSLVSAAASSTTSASSARSATAASSVGWYARSPRRALPNRHPRPTPTPTPTTTPTSGPTTAPTTGPTSVLPYRYMTDSSADQAGAVGAGYNLMDVGPYASTLNALPAGVGGLVWLGDYDNTTCQFTNSDSWVVSHLTPIAGNAKAVGFYIADEPHNATCPTAPADVAARSALVHRLAPGTFTYIVVLDGYNHPGEYAAFRGSADVMGLDPYPCTFINGCDVTKIDAAVSRARAAGVTHIWGVLQAFQDDYYRYPSASELTTMIAHWQTAGIEGQQTFAWSYHANSLDTRPDLVSVLASYNAGTLR